MKTRPDNASFKHALHILLLTICTIPPMHADATALLVKGKTAEISVKVVYVKAGAGKAFVNRGRLYQGDLVTILSKKNLSSWVEIQSGRVKGYVPLKVLRFDTRTAPNSTDLNQLRRLEDYEYDTEGRRIKHSGDRAGSGEQEKQRALAQAKLDGRHNSPVTINLGIGAGRFQRFFSSNAPVQSILSKAEAEPVVFTTQAELNYRVSSKYQLSARFLDYRLGLTQLQTPVLNEGLPFDIDNEGQLLAVAGSFSWNRTNLGIAGGPVLSIQRHQFRRTEPLPIFLSSLTTSIGIQAVLTAHVPGANMMLMGEYGNALNSSQTPESGGSLQSGYTWSVRAIIDVPINDMLSGTLEGLMSHEEVERAGQGSHVDNITDPNNELLYTASRDINQLSAVLIGIRWVP
jgi:hypothetical protein